MHFYCYYYYCCSSVVPRANQTTKIPYVYSAVVPVITSYNTYTKRGCPYIYYCTVAQS